MRGACESPHPSRSFRFGKIQFDAPSGHLHMTPALERRRDHEQIGRTRADVRVIQAGGVYVFPDAEPGRPRPRRQPGGRGPAATDRCPRPLPYGRHIRCLERFSSTGCALSKAAASLLEPPRTVVSRLILSTTCNSTSRSASICTVRCAAPGRGEHGNWVSSASPAPFSFRSQRG